MRELLYKIWKLNDGFPIVTAFLLSLGMVWILVGIGCMNFDFVLPYLFLIFFLYGFSGKRGVVGIAGAWCREGEIRHKVIAAAVLLVIGNGLFLEGVLKAEKLAQWIAVTVLFLILYLYIWFVLKECKKVSLYSALGGIVFALFAATGNLTIYEEHGWWGYGSALLGWFCLFTLCLECCFELTVRSSIFCAGPVKEKEQKRKIRRWGAGSFLASFAVDVVFLLAFYPGVMEYDSLKQMEQIWGGRAL